MTTWTIAITLLAFVNGETLAVKDYPTNTSYETEEACLLDEKIIVHRMVDNVISGDPEIAFLPTNSLRLRSDCKEITVQ